MESIIEVSYAGGMMEMRLCVENSGRTTLTYYHWEETTYYPPEPPNGKMIENKSRELQVFDSPMNWIKKSSS